MEEHRWRQQEEGRATGGCGREDGSLPLGAVAERRVAAGDADGVQPAGAELLITRGGDEAGPGGGAGLPIVYSCKRRGITACEIMSRLGGYDSWKQFLSLL